VTFRYKDYADDQRHKTTTLTAEEFLRRFVQHVLPKGFVKMRHYGLLANRQRAAKLERSRRLLLPAMVAAASVEPALTLDAPKIEPAPVPHCPQCGGCRFVTFELPKEVSASCGDTS
jgi:hypothetical protein